MLRDETLREQIAQIICPLKDDPTECEKCEDKGCPDTWKDLTEKTDQILALVGQEEPPVLRDSEIENCISEFCSVLEGHRQALREVAKAQRDSDIKWYKERLKYGEN